jgi:hypothetical protein
MKNAEELSDIDQVVPSSESASEYPFIDVGQESDKKSEEEKKNEELQSHEEEYALEEHGGNVKSPR